MQTPSIGNGASAGRPRPPWSAGKAKMPPPSEVGYSARCPQCSTSLRVPSELAHSATAAPLVFKCASCAAVFSITLPGASGSGPAPGPGRGGGWA